jgi:hypothetical protein
MQMRTQARFERPLGSQDDQRFLTPDRVEQIAELIEPLIHTDLSWIDRRKESVEILDDTALRRQISVDFSLRSSAKPLLDAREEDQDEDLFCAPVFVLPKAPANLMAFDLEDERGHALSLIGREDNARISAAVLDRMASRILIEEGHDLPESLSEELRRAAEADGGRGHQLALRLLAHTDWPAELGLLRHKQRFCWWLTTLGHSSLVVALFRSAGPRRKLVKLRFEQPIATKQRRLTSLGWAPYQVGIDTSLVEARRYHFEAAAPPGLRITEASFSDDQSETVVSDSGFLRRVHLYRPRAEAARAGTAVLWLRISGHGFVGGAAPAALFTTVALLACFLSARNIAMNPTSAPALLLVLPGLIATYVGRPDQHALTTRLLSSARRLLLFSACLAYIAAARVALSGGAERIPEKIDHRTDSLQWWLGILLALSLIPLGMLSVTWVRGRLRPKSAWRTARFDEGIFVATPPGELFQAIRAQSNPFALPPEYELLDDDGHCELHYARSCWHGTWVITVQVRECDGESIVRCAGEHVTRLRGAPSAPFIEGREAASVAACLATVQDWAVRP